MHQGLRFAAECLARMAHARGRLVGGKHQLLVLAPRHVAAGGHARTGAVDGRTRFACVARQGNGGCVEALRGGSHVGFGFRRALAQLVGGVAQAQQSLVGGCVEIFGAARDLVACRVHAAARAVGFGSKCGRALAQRIGRLFQHARFFGRNVAQFDGLVLECGMQRVELFARACCKRAELVGAALQRFVVEMGLRDAGFGCAHQAMRFGAEGFTRGADARRRLVGRQHKLVVLAPCHVAACFHARSRIVDRLGNFARVLGEQACCEIEALGHGRDIRVGLLGTGAQLVGRIAKACRGLVRGRVEILGIARHVFGHFADAVARGIARYFDRDRFEAQRFARAVELGCDGIGRFAQRACLRAQIAMQRFEPFARARGRRGDVFGAVLERFGIGVGFGHAGLGGAHHALRLGAEIFAGGAHACGRLLCTQFKLGSFAPHDLAGRLDARRRAVEGHGNFARILDEGLRTRVEALGRGRNVGFALERARAQTFGAVVELLGRELGGGVEFLRAPLDRGTRIAQPRHCGIGRGVDRFGLESHLLARKREFLRGVAGRFGQHLRLVAHMVGQLVEALGRALRRAIDFLGTALERGAEFFGARERKLCRMGKVLRLHAHAFARRAHALGGLFGRNEQLFRAAAGNLARGIDACGHAVERLLRAHRKPIEGDLRFGRAAGSRVEIFGPRLERNAGGIHACLGAHRRLGDLARFGLQGGFGCQRFGRQCPSRAQNRLGFARKLGTGFGSTAPGRIHGLDEFAAMAADVLADGRRLCFGILQALRHIARGFREARTCPAHTRERLGCRIGKLARLRLESFARCTHARNRLIGRRRKLVALATHGLARGFGAHGHALDRRLHVARFGREVRCDLVHADCRTRHFRGARADGFAGRVDARLRIACRFGQGGGLRAQRVLGSVALLGKLARDRDEFFGGIGQMVAGGFGRTTRGAHFDRGGARPAFGHFGGIAERVGLAAQQFAHFARAREGGFRRVGKRTALVGKHGADFARPSTCALGRLGQILRLLAQGFADGTGIGRGALVGRG